MPTPVFLRLVASPDKTLFGWRGHINFLAIPSLRTYSPAYWVVT